MAKKNSKTSTKTSAPKSFRRAYREDYRRETSAPGIMRHIVATFKIIFGNWKLFLPLLVIAVILSVVFVGTISANYAQLQEAVKQTDSQIPKAGLLLVSAAVNGGLLGGSSKVASVFGALIFLIIWLTTIFFLRHRMVGHDVNVRDGLYNAMAPLISTLVIFALVVVECIPIFLVIIFYSAAVQTEFLTMPFYALLFLVFAILMFILSGYLLSNSLLALVAISAPGLYPIKALRKTKELITNRRMKFVMRILALVLFVVLMWVVIMIPMIILDSWIKNFEWAAGIPFIPVCFTVMTCATYIYVTTYLYLYYRWMLES